MSIRDKARERNGEDERAAENYLCSRCGQPDVMFSLRYRADGTPCKEPEEREKAHHITRLCLSCYDKTREPTPPEVELEDRLDANPQWFRQDGEPRSQYIARIRKIQAAMGGLGKMPS